jgi:hypothetical protein
MDIWFTLFVTVAGLLAAVGFSLLMIGYLVSLMASLQSGWRNWLYVLALPFIGGLIFSYRDKEVHLKTARQLAIGLLCLAGSFGMLYGAGPAMVRYMAGNIQAEMAANPAANSAEVNQSSQVSTPAAAVTK